MNTYRIRGDTSRRATALVVLLLVALAAGTGIVAADEDANDGKQCPGENPNRAWERASDAGVEHSADGFAVALPAAGCTT